MSFCERRPCHGISFEGVSTTNDLGRKDGILGGKGRMLGQIKDIQFGSRTTSGHKEMVLWHVPSPIDFSLMLDLHANFNLSNIGGSVSKSTDFSLFFIVGRSSLGFTSFSFTSFSFFIFSPIVNHHIVFWQIARSHHQIILFVAGRMGSNQQRVFIGGGSSILDGGQPFTSQTGPFKSMRHDDIIQVWCILLPYFVLGIN
mmetsp:Transcript_27408/g.66557  ORF Transcript_27408/g.66557 Transcript_27408/m.66557 type:complete len:200 (-) Transcript_27408:71-670(-)